MPSYLEKDTREIQKSIPKVVDRYTVHRRQDGGTELRGISLLSPTVSILTSGY